MDGLGGEDPKHMKPMRRRLPLLSKGVMIIIGPGSAQRREVLRMAWDWRGLRTV